MTNNKKVIPYKRRFQPNFLRIIFMLVFIYIVVLCINYIKKEHISIYEVNETKIADDTTLKGIILRKEQIVTTEQAGYINYFNPEGNKIGVGNVVYMIDNTGNVANTIGNISTSNEITTEEIAELRNVIAKYQSNFNPAQFNNIYEYQYDIKNAVLEQSKQNLYNDLEQILAKQGQSDTVQRVTAKRSGIVSYSIDGFENIKSADINAETFGQELTMQKTQLRSTNTVAAGAPAYRLITSEEWQLVVPLTTEYYEKLKDKSVVRIKVKKDNISFNASLTIEQRADGYYAVLSSSRFMQRYMNDRFLEIELNINSAEGLKIPNSSIVEEEFYCVDASYALASTENSDKVLVKEVMKDGVADLEFVSLKNAILINHTYYVRKTLLSAGDTIINQTTGEKCIVQTIEKLNGVYCVNEGYCKFIYMEKIYENAEYTIISSETPNGLAVFDHIVVNPKTLNENDFIQ